MGCGVVQVYPAGHTFITEVYFMLIVCSGMHSLPDLSNLKVLRVQGSLSDRLGDSECGICCTALVHALVLSQP